MSKKKEVEDKTEVLQQDIEEIGFEIEEKPSKYTFSMKPSIRERLKALSKYYGKTTDSAFLQDIIEQLYAKIEDEID